LGVSPDYDTTQHAHAQKITKRSGDADLSEQGPSPDYETAQHAHAHNKPSAVEKGEGGIWLFLWL